MDNLGNVIKDLRKSRELNQEEFSKILGIDRSTLSRYEKGVVPVSIKHAKIISEYFNIPITKLIESKHAVNKLYDKLKEKNVITDDMTDEELDSIIDDVADVLKMIRKKK